MTQLELLNQKLNTDKYAAVTVTNIQTNQVLCKNKISQDIIGEFGTADNMFDSFLNNGHTNLKVEPRRKNGTAFKDVDTVFTISPEVQNAPVLASSVNQDTINIADEIKKKKKKKKNKMFGLAGGLSGADIINLNVKASQVDDLKERNRDLLSDNNRLKEKYEELKIEQLEKKYTKENNDSRNALMLQGLQTLPMLAGAFGIKIPQAGLSSPDASLSEIQNKILDKVKTNPDELNQIFFNVMNRLDANPANEEFREALFSCLSNHKII